MRTLANRCAACTPKHTHVIAEGARTVFGPKRTAPPLIHAPQGVVFSFSFTHTSNVRLQMPHATPSLSLTHTQPMHPSHTSHYTVHTHHVCLHEDDGRGIATPAL